MFSPRPGSRPVCFPVTRYHEQWTRLLQHADGLKAFLEGNKAKLQLRARE